jgi:hypothetical protein
VQPALALIGIGLGCVEPLPCGLVDLVLVVDEPARGEADELLVEELDCIVAVEGRTT